MKRTVACAVLLGLAIAVAGCGSSSSTASEAASAAPASAPAASASVGPSSNIYVPAPPSAEVAGSTASAATDTSTPVVAGGDTCKFLSAADAAALLPNLGPAKVFVTQAAFGTTTTCTWGAGSASNLFVTANELNSPAGVAAIKAAVVKAIKETIPGLGDVGGFIAKTPTNVSVVFVKGSTQVELGVASSSVDADAVVAAAKKMADGI